MMSCEHGEHPDHCERCEEIECAYKSGYKDGLFTASFGADEEVTPAPDLFVAMGLGATPKFPTLAASAAPEFRIVSKDDSTAWLQFDGGAVCLNNIANDLGPITRDKMSAAIVRFLAAPAAPVAAPAPSESFIETMRFALLDAKGFAELIDALAKPDVEIYKHELRGDADLAMRRLDIALEKLEEYAALTTPGAP